MKSISITKLERDGFVLIKKCLDASYVNNLRQLFPENELSRAGIRNLLVDFSEVVKLAQLNNIRSLVESILGENAVAVRALYFNKTSDANWRVRWHQDKTIAVKSREDLPGYTAWSIKNEVVHVHPPKMVMENMLAVRVHLDAAGDDSGGLRVCPGSHKRGILKVDEIQDNTTQVDSIIPPAEPGDVLLMRPLLVHSSERCFSDQRRVIHIEFAGSELPKPLHWHRAIRASA